MSKIINSEWQSTIMSKIYQHQEIDETISFRPASQWLIIQLTNVGISFKIFNLGLGVNRISTKTDICPCCRQKL